MYKKLIKNDIKKSKLITITIAIFVLLAALLTSLAAILMTNLLSAIDNMMIQAKTPHFMQMHSGDIDTDRLNNFANVRNDVEGLQILEFLNIEGAEIVINGTSLVGSVQDNGLATQSKDFDFLLDLQGNIIYPTAGEIYVPIYYMKENHLSVGDTVTIHGEPFTVAGFLRDSQMNPSMISSKRFLVSDSDFENLKKFGKLEYLIEFRLQNDVSLAAFESSYLGAGLEANGPPAITYPLFKMANAITDGLMIAVLILISILVMVVTFLCIRFTLIAKVEEDYKEIGVLKAIGIRISNIKKIYMAKYGAIALVSCILGFLLSLAIQNTLLENIRLYMGEGTNAMLGLLLGLLGAALIFLIILFYVSFVLRRFRKISAAEAMRFGAPQEKAKGAKNFKLSTSKLFSANMFLGIKGVLSRKSLYVTMLLVLIIASFIMIVPQNIYNTISSRNFMTYMGIGNCDMRFDVQQTDNIAEKTKLIESAIAQDNSILRHTVLMSHMFEMPMNDGTTQRIKVELGDHSIFPIEYSSGGAPQTQTEIAVSALNADDLEKTVGDKITLLVDGKEKQLTICGVYSDITNGGKTAKATFEAGSAEILWSIIPVELSDSSLTAAKVSEYQDLFSFAKVANIDEYIRQTFGSTVSAIQKASVAAIVAATLLAILVTVLFFKMLTTKDRYSIVVLKSLGFTSADICRQYIAQSMLVLILGVVIGTVLSNTLGELVGVALISSFGVSSFHFEINPLFAYLFSPIVIALCVYAATRFGVRDIGSLKVSEYIKE